MKRQAQMVSRSCFFQLRQLRSITHSVDQYTAAALIHAFITGRLDYCNGLLAGAPRVVTDVYQNVHNAELQDFWQDMVVDSMVYAKLCVTSFTGCG